MKLSIVGAVELSQAQVRLIGCLMEKERTTPTEYPLSANALMRAANQSTSRDPIVSYDQNFVEAELARLKDLGLVRYVFSQSNRATKFRHIADELFGLSEAEVVVLSLLFLRGDQTAGELRTRAERVLAFPSTEAVMGVLDGLADRAEPLVMRRGRRPGQSGDRYGHRWRVDQPTVNAPGGGSSGTFGAGGSPSDGRASVEGDRTLPVAVGAPTLSDEVSALRNELEAMRKRLDLIWRELGLDGSSLSQG